MRHLGTDNAISGPMRGLKINCIKRGQHSTFTIQNSTHGHCNSMNDPAQRAESVRILKYVNSLKAE